VKDFLKDFGRWLDDPMTQALMGGLGALVIFADISSAHRRINAVEDRLDRVERRKPKDG